MTSLPATSEGSSVGNLCNGIASTTMSADATASAAQRGSAPGASTWTISSMFSGSPDAAIDTG